MHGNSIAASRFGAMFALWAIILYGNPDASAQSISYVGPEVNVYSVWQISSMSPTQPVYFGAASYWALGTAGQWNAGDDQGTSSANPSPGIDSSIPPIYITIDADGRTIHYTDDNREVALRNQATAPTIVSFDTGVVMVTIPSDDLSCCRGGPDIVMLKNSAAVSGEWFQSNSPAGPK